MLTELVTRRRPQKGIQDWIGSPSHLNWLHSKWRSNSSSLSSDRVTELPYLKWRTQPPYSTTTNFRCFYPGRHSFDHNLELMAADESLNKNWQVDWELRSLSQPPAQRPHDCGCCTNPPINPPSLVNNTQYYTPPPGAEALHPPRKSCLFNGKAGSKISTITNQWL